MGHFIIYTGGKVQRARCFFAVLFTALTIKETLKIMHQDTIQTMIISSYNSSDYCIKAFEGK